MTKKLVDVLIMYKAMEALEGAKLEFTPPGSIRYARHRAAVQAHFKSFEAAVGAEYEKAPVKDQAALVKAHDIALAAINGEDVVLQLPPPVPAEWIVALPTPSRTEHEALMILAGVVLGVPEEPNTA